MDITIGNRSGRAWACVAGAALMLFASAVATVAVAQDEPANMVSSAGTDLDLWETDNGTVLIRNYITRPNLVAGIARCHDRRALRNRLCRITQSNA